MDKIFKSSVKFDECHENMKNYSKKPIASGEN